MSKTIVGLFSSMTQGEQVKTRLVGEGYASSDISVIANDENHANDYDDADTSTHRYDGKVGIGEKISNFFSSLTGGDEAAHHHFAHGVNAGGALVTVKVDDDQEYEVTSRLREYGAREIEGDTGYAQTDYGAPGTDATGRRLSQNSENLAHEVTPLRETGTATGYPSGQTTTIDDRSKLSAIPVVEEELLVGKRDVDRGGVRVYSQVREIPVETEVTLRDERIVLERRPVNRPASPADFEAGRAASIELTATSEEAVIGKQARVVEEVLVGKESSQHTQTISDSVRRTDVEVEEVPGEVVSGGQTY